MTVSDSQGQHLRVLMVCSGNICRSPMAEILLRKIISGSSSSGEVTSAGTLNIQGAPAARFARKAIAEQGLDLNYHRSRGLSYPLLLDQDILIVMEPSHEAHLKHTYPKCHVSVVRLWEFFSSVDEGTRDELTEIKDPQGGTLEEFRECRDLLTRCLGNWAKVDGTLRV